MPWWPRRSCWRRWSRRSSGSWPRSPTATRNGQRYLRDEVGCALKIAPATAVQRLQDAVQLCGRLFEAYELVAAGLLSAANAKVLARAVGDLPGEVAVKMQERVLPGGCAQTPGEFRATVRGAVARLGRKDQAAKHAEAYPQRNVISYPAEDYLADVVLQLPAPEPQPESVRQDHDDEPPPF